MNNNDIYKKSDLGRDEIKSQSLGVLPREARTLLIMIDGKKTYQNYIDSLNDSAMFAEFGGIAPLFELLLEFRCIETSEQTDIIAKRQSSTIPMAAPQSRSSSVDAPQTAISLSMPSSQAPQAKSYATFNNEAEFATQFDSKGIPKQESSTPPKRGFFARKANEMSYETIKSDLATYIEKNAQSQDAWGYLLSLEQCENAAQLLALVQRIQNSTSRDGLARGMDKYQKSLKE